jgi:hypothetical protein
LTRAEGLTHRETGERLALVFEQVTIDVQGTKLTSFADNVEITKVDPAGDGTIWIDIEENKTGGATMTDAQEAVFNKLQGKLASQREVDAQAAELDVKLPQGAVDMLKALWGIKNPRIMIENYVVVHPQKGATHKARKE